MATISAEYASRNPSVNLLNIYLPEGKTKCPVFIYFHAGALIHVDHNVGKYAFVDYLTSHGIAVVSANYHLDPISKGNRDVKFPLFIEDAAEAVAWVMNNISQYCEPDGIYVGGSSQGAYLSAMLCFDKQWLGKHDISPLDIKGFVHDAPLLTTHFSVLREKGLANNRVIIDESAPLFYVGTEKEYAPMLFVNATEDAHTRLSQTKLMVTVLKNLGHTQPKIQTALLEGTHCSYAISPDDRFGKVIQQFIESI
jgi:acetyl esterase/lipase